jgi:hypothetical protein
MPVLILFFQSQWANPLAPYFTLNTLREVGKSLYLQISTFCNVEIRDSPHCHAASSIAASNIWLLFPSNTHLLMLLQHRPPGNLKSLLRSWYHILSRYYILPNRWCGALASMLFHPSLFSQCSLANALPLHLLLQPLRRALMEEL